MGSRIRALIILTIWSTLMASGVQAEAPDQDVSSSLSEAERFRLAHGLAADGGTLIRAASDSTEYGDIEFGVPLSISEATEIRRRVDLVQRLAPATAFIDGLSSSAGVYVDHHAGGIPVFLFTDDLGYYGDLLKAVIPAGVEFRVDRAAFSTADLEELQGAVEDARGELLRAGISVRLTGLDVRRNRVTVGVERLDEHAQAALEARFGAGIAVRNEGRGEADACSTYRDCWPLKGGIEIYSASGGGICTSGFVGRKHGTSTYAIITAGHCLARWGGSGIVWKHGTSTVYPWGVSQQNTWFADADADAGIIHIDTADIPQLKNIFLTTPAVARSLTSVTPATSQIVGQTVCRTGRTSGNDCGTLLQKNVIRDSCVDFPSGEICKRLHFQNEVDFDSDGGDSGGTVYVNYSGLGVLIDSERPEDPLPHYGWYSTLSSIRTQYFESYGILYDVCISATCSTVWP